MSFAQCNGTKIAYQQFGEGPDVIMVHGLASNRAFWYADLAQQLKQHFRITLYDLRGHGYSERTLGGYAAQDMAFDLAELMAELSIPHAHLIGHSYGGGVALELASLNPHKVDSLVLLDTKVNSLQPYQYLADSEYLSPFEREVMAASGFDWSNEPHLGLRYLEIMARLRLNGFESASKDLYTPFASSPSGKRAAKQYLALLEETRAEEEFKMNGASRDEIAQLQPPILLMYGEYSRCLRSGRAMLDLLDKSKFCIVPEAGHFFPASHARLVMDELAVFLDFDHRHFRPAELLQSAS